MISGDDDAQECRRGVEEEQRANPTTLREWPHRKHAPRRPSDVQRWHRCVLIRQRRTWTLIESPWSAEFGDRVDEPEVLRTVVVAQLVLDARATLAEVGARFVEQTRWHEGEEDEADECETGHGRERVAPLAEHVRTLLEEHEEDRERDEEMGGSVVRVHHLDEPRMREEPILDRLLVVQPERSLDTNHAYCIREGVQGNLDPAHERGTELIADQGVRRVERTDDEHLFPPQGAVVAGDGNDRWGSWRVVHVVHRISDRALD